ncbi:hypothetical protein HS088_TW16G00259 [Tripterygium wilfordii]|uniref:Membrane lipoprotein n=1 Tax=Tripterygium wilfordii TaxID=458696 RepID=A0A7J7CID4_TRIWF|nr:hypothetical protein HS088_TW16G00259 [Tripterygium wilfordii]
MKSLSGVGLGLSVVFGCLLLALVAELCYILWWKKRITNSEIEDDSYGSPAKQLLFMFCWRKPSSLRVTDTLVHEPEAQIHSLHSNNNDFLLKAYGDNDDDMETELLGLNSLTGPPRFLFTIVEETREDLESEDAKSKSAKGSRGRSLSDLILTVETPYLTPLASPSFFTPPLTPLDSTSCKGFNPLFFESSTDAEFNRIRSSPPPRFKFLQDAEQKLYRQKLMEESEKKVNSHDGFSQQFLSGSKFFKDEEEESSFITIIVDRNKERELKHHGTSSQILPLNSPPPTTSRSAAAAAAAAEVGFA